MGMQINTNLAANNAYRSLSNTQNDLSKSLEKLSSGLRINRAGDDAAGLALSEGLKSQIGGLSVAARNAQDGIGAIQTAEGGLNQAHSILQRLRDLSVQAANDTNNDDSRKAIGKEASQLVNELGRIADSTDFNGKKLLDGSVGSMTFQVGANLDSSSQIDINLADVKAVSGGLGDGNLGANFAVATGTTGTQAFTVTDGTSTSLVTVDFGTATYDTATDVAAALNKDSAFSEKMFASVNADGELNVKSLSGGVVDDTTPPGTGLTAGTAPVAGTGTLDFMSAAGARAAIGLVDAQIKTVSEARADLGASQNRLESAVQTINIAKENLTASNSRIRDTDMAEEMVKFTRNNILSQAGTAMLAQANQSNQGVLQLLR